MAGSGSLFVVAAVQAAPVYLSRAATVDKACDLIREAGRGGARLVAFPEVFVPGFPHWIYLDRPQANERHFVELVREAVEVPGPATDALGRAARDASAYVVIGVNERSRRSAGELFNTNLIFAPDGALLGWHRKLMPTYAEKMIWSFGDGSTLRVHGDRPPRHPLLRREHEPARALRPRRPGRAGPRGQLPGAPGGRHRGPQVQHPDPLGRPRLRGDMLRRGGREPDQPGDA